MPTPAGALGRCCIAISACCGAACLSPRWARGCSSWLLLELADSPFLLGLQGVFMAVPFILSSLYGGALADLRGWSPFVALQVHYNLTDRSAERDLLPMARALDLGVTVWSPLAAGILTGKYALPEGEAALPAGTRFAAAAPDFRMAPHQAAAARAVRQVADASGLPTSPVALAWLRQRAGVIIPILGARSAAQLAENLGCLDVALDAEHLQILDEASAVELGYPHALLADKAGQAASFGPVFAQIDHHHLR